MTAHQLMQLGVIRTEGRTLTICLRKWSLPEVLYRVADLNCSQTKTVRKFETIILRNWLGGRRSNSGILPRDHFRPPFFTHSSCLLELRGARKALKGYILYKEDCGGIRPFWFGERGKTMARISRMKRLPGGYTTLWIRGAP